VSRFGRLFPQRPYSVQINTFHVPSVESTLLQTFSRGTNFVHTAPVVFRDTLVDTIRYLDMGVHIEEDVDPVSLFVPTGLSRTLDWVIGPPNVIWTPRCLPNIRNALAKNYKVLIALHLRVNGASDLFARMRKAMNKNGVMPKGDVIGTKVKEFIDRHVQLAAYMDSVDDPRDDMLPPQYRDVASFGPTDYAEDREFIRIDVKTLPLERTPLEVLRGGEGEHTLFYGSLYRDPTEADLGRIARQIRERDTNDELDSRFVNCGPDDETCAYDYYYPVRMTSPDECRAHSWYLASLVMINDAYRRMTETEENSEDEDDSRNEENAPMHSLKHIHAFHRIMGSFVPLFYHALCATGGGEESTLSDEVWRPKPDGRPTLFDKYFPCDTACFHAGDLPNLGGLFEQVGMYGVQNVKTKIPLVRAIIKSLPVCCQSRDLVKTFLTECRAANGEGNVSLSRLIY
jgi:hypothetical protein